MKDDKRIVVDIGGFEVAIVTYDGTEFIVSDDDDGGEEYRFPRDQDKECAIFIADTNCTTEVFDEIRPDRIRIELLKDGEREELSTFEIYHDEFAEFCVRNKGDNQKIERRLQQLYEDGNRFCRTSLLMFLRKLQGDLK